VVDARGAPRAASGMGCLQNGALTEGKAAEGAVAVSRRDGEGR